MYPYRSSSLQNNQLEKKKIQRQGKRRMADAQKDFESIKQFVKNLTLIETSALALINLLTQLEKTFMAALQGTFRAIPQFKQMREVQDPFTNFCTSLQNKVDFVKSQDPEQAIEVCQQKLRHMIDKVSKWNV